MCAHSQMGAREQSSCSQTLWCLSHAGLTGPHLLWWPSSALTWHLQGSGHSELGPSSQLTPELRSINPFTPAQADNTPCIISRCRETTRSKGLKWADPRQNNTDRKGSALVTERYRPGLACQIEASCRERRANGKTQRDGQSERNSSLSLIKQKWSRCKPGDLRSDILHSRPLTCS